jgi:uncharacterized protein (DUF952 family)
MRWLYHIVERAPELEPGGYEHPSLRTEGFIHCSFAPSAHESARLYFAPKAQLWLLKIDPRQVDLRVEQTQRGPMPHVFGVIPAAAIVAVVQLTPELALEDAL